MSTYSDNSLASSAGIEQRLMQVQEFLDRRDFAGAAQAASRLAREVPENRDVLLRLAIAQRFLGDIDQAMSTLQQLESVHPTFSRLFEERGHCLVVKRNAVAAIDAFLRAVNLNAALPASWSMLVGLYRMTGDHANASTATAHVDVLKALPPQIVVANSLFADGDVVPAERIVRRYLLEEGEHVEAMRLLARIGLSLGVLDDAETLLAEVVRRAPDYTAARVDYAHALVERHHYPLALAQLDILADSTLESPMERQCRTMRASALTALGRHDEAISLYRHLIDDLPEGMDPSPLHLSIAHALKTMGKTGQAIDTYRAAIQARPDFGDAYWSLANLKTYRFSEQEMDAMRTQIARPDVATDDRQHLHFALGKALEDAGDAARSWSSYQEGNRLKREESRYRPEIIEPNTRRQREVCTAEFFSQRNGWGAPAVDPIFIVGLPRSGSTLIEQILASHPLVEGTQELADIPRLVLQLQGRDPDLEHPRYPRTLLDLSADDARRFGEKYLKETQVFRTSGRPIFIDKMPNNFRHIGLIHLILPNARIIDARREPMACCVSNLKQLFANGQEFTYSMEDIARYYRTYLELMRHWDIALPGRVLRVQHEDLIEDLESSVRRLLDFCGLEFDQKCVEFHRTERSVRTPSSEQVRRPIFRDAMEQWRLFEPWLEPLKQSLGDALSNYRD